MMFNIRVFRSVTLAHLALLMGIMTTDAAIAKEKNLGNQLAPMPFPKGTPLGATVYGVARDGSRTTTKVIKFDGRYKTWQAEDDCRFVVDVDGGYFGPLVSWSNCTGGDGSTKMVKKSGNIWPLAVGNTETYRYRGKSPRGVWSETRKCKVAKQVRIKTHTGEHDTFKVVCRSEWSVRTYYLSPKLDRSVKNVRRKTSSRSRVSPRNWEFTSLKLR